jgi:hypothetical protein
VDFWGTLVLDSPAGDERYEGRRLSGFAAILREQGLEFSVAQLARAYARSGEFIGKIWSTGRDVRFCSCCSRSIRERVRLPTA